MMGDVIICIILLFIYWELNELNEKFSDDDEEEK